MSMITSGIFGFSVTRIVQTVKDFWRGWNVVSGDRGTCQVQAKYRKVGDPFLQITQDGRALKVNSTEILAIRESP